MIIEIMGPSGVGKTFYSKKLETKLGFSRIKPDIKKVILKKLLYLPLSLLITINLNPRMKNFIKCLVHVLFLTSYRNLSPNNKEILIMDQGIIFHFSQICKYCKRDYKELFDYFFERKRYTYPNDVVEIIAKKEVVYNRRKYRGDKLNPVKRKDIQFEYTKVNNIIKRTIKKLGINHLKFYTKDNDSDEFLNYILKNNNEQ